MVTVTDGRKPLNIVSDSEILCNSGRFIAFYPLWKLVNFFSQLTMFVDWSTG